MGADLIVFLSKGPEKFTKAKIKKAQSYAEKVILFASEVYEVLQKRNKRLEEQPGEPLTPEEDRFLENCLRDERLRRFNDQEQYSDIIECEHKMEEMAACTAKDEVDRFIAWWTSCSGRDTAGRSDPDNKNQKIVVCGDMSWGDAPSGYGYTTMTRAEWFNIPSNLGVR